MIEEAAELLDRLRLLDCAHELTASCPTAANACSRSGWRSRSSRACCLLDEPAAGVPEGEGAELYAALAELPRTVAVLLIEHDMDLVFRFARASPCWWPARFWSRVRPRRFLPIPRVREVYLGEAEHG